jgi:peptidyl-prolyl cis-trans isomerase C
MMRSIDLGSAFLLLVAASLAMAGETKPGEAGREVVCRVNGSEILRRDVEAAKQKLLPMASFHGKVDAGRQRTMRREALQGLIDRELKFQDAQKRGLGVSRKEVDREYKRLVAKHADEKALKAQYERMGVSEKDVKAALERRMTVERAEREIASSGGKVGPEEALRYYEARRDVFRLPRRAVVKQLLVKMPPLERSEADWHAAVDRANELRSRLLGEAVFESVVEQASEGAWMDRIEGTSLEEVHPGQLETPLDDALWAIEAGGVSQPIRAFRGVYLLQVERFLEPRQLPFEEIETRLIKLVQAEHERERLTEWLSGLRSAAEVEILDSELLPEGQDVSLRGKERPAVSVFASSTRFATIRGA